MPFNSSPGAHRLAIKVGVISAAAALAIGSGRAKAAEAEAAPAAPGASAPPASKPSDGGLTFRGVMLYGVVDIGAAYLNHGAPLSATFGPGLPFMVQKFSDRSTFSLAPNGLSQSKIGLSGAEPIVDGVSFVFRLETGFQPSSGRLTDGPASLIKDNGRPLTAYVASGDLSRAGQPFQGAAYAGFSSKSFGALTYGWQNSLILDDLIKYDPQAQSYAFSPIGYSGVAAGGGDGEDGRLGSSLKYAVGLGPLRLALLHQFGRSHAIPEGAEAANVGLDLGPLSVDAVFDKVKGAVAAASLTAAQNLAHPGTIAATISDNTTYSVQARYAFRRAKLYAGYEHIEYGNASDPLAAGAGDIGGYTIGVINNTAFTTHKILQISWIGLRYAATPKLDVAGAYYRYDQNSYKGNSCSDESAGSCSGSFYEVSATAIYKLVGHLDLYGGVVSSRVMDGLASGYLKTAATGPMAGVRFSF